MNLERRIDLVAGWGLFGVSALVYLLTIEPTASFWDCGEFIACGHKLMVGHPPGAPLFMLIMRLFTMFAPSPDLVGAFANTMSALASAATVMFLYWSIAHLGRKLLSNEMPPLWQRVLLVGASAVGALAYTFTDTFWFSAVEGEVYALSSLFTAVVFWAALKWEDEWPAKSAARWLVLIAYLMGLSIGVHLLNLLVIPAIALVYYFRVHQYSHWGLIKTLLISSAILLLVLYGVIQGLVVLAAYSDLLFVNSFGLPFWSGAAFFALLLGGAVVWGLWYTQKRGKRLANIALMCFAMLLVGYGSYGVIVIRSASSPTLDQNGVDDLFALQAYLNREQYGDRPLFSGPYYNAPETGYKEGSWMYGRHNGRYEPIRRRLTFEYDERLSTFLPRMWSSDPAHVQGYKSWVGEGKKPIQIADRNGQPKTELKPTFAQNLSFMFQYQMGFMYWRYFMWNFAGRQNDYQGFGHDPMRGNWISGIPFLDNARLGDQSLLPDELRDNAGRNAYFMLPLLLGLVGLLFHFRRAPKGAGIVLCLFILTGLAIVLYLNQKPYEPRERDYTFAGSFYAYAIWIGLGVIGLSRWVTEKVAGMKIGPIVAIAASFIAVPTVLAQQNWDDHDRSHRYVALDFAHNMLAGCGPQGILFTYADNDTFPLWYALEVNEIRQDVRICNLTYLGADWYVDVMRRAAYTSPGLPFGITRDIYREGVNDNILLRNVLNRPINLKEGLAFAFSEDERTKLRNPYVGGKYISYIPGDTLLQPITRDAMSAISPQLQPLAHDTLRLVPGVRGLYRNGYSVYAAIAGNDWKRPMYYSPMLPSAMQWGLPRHMAKVGLTSQILPIEHDPKKLLVDTAAATKNLMEVYRFRSINDPRVYLDETCKRQSEYYISAFCDAANMSLDLNDKPRARMLLKKLLEAVPPQRMGIDNQWIPVLYPLYSAGMTEEADALLEVYKERANRLQAYAKSLPAHKQGLLTREVSTAFQVVTYIEGLRDELVGVGR